MSWWLYLLYIYDAWNLSRKGLMQSLSLFKLYKILLSDLPRLYENWWNWSDLQPSFGLMLHTFFFLCVTATSTGGCSILGKIKLSLKNNR